MGTSEGELATSTGYDLRGRRLMTVAEFAQGLDLGMHFSHVDGADLDEGCRLALERGLAAVTCRPDQLPMAARQLAGSAVSVVSGLSFHARREAPICGAGWRREARALSGQGATELAVIATPERLRDSGGAPFYDALEELLSAQRADGYRLRVHLDTGGLTDAEITAACQRLAAAGVWMVQGGSWKGERTAFRHLERMRTALGPGPLLKWTHPVTFHVMLLAMAYGVDRFNADVVQLLQEADRKGRYAPIAVPLAGIDF
ncbi:hypothetical protein GCM10028802_41490 [Terrabacter terrigena]